MVFCFRPFLPKLLQAGSGLLEGPSAPANCGTQPEKTMKQTQAQGGSVARLDIHPPHALFYGGWFSLCRRYVTLM